MVCAAAALIASISPLAPSALVRAGRVEGRGNRDQAQRCDYQSGTQHSHPLLPPPGIDLIIYLIIPNSSKHLAINIPWVGPVVPGLRFIGGRSDDVCAFF